MRRLSSLAAFLVLALPTHTADSKPRAGQGATGKAPASPTIIINSSDLGDSGCDSVLPAGQKPVSLKQAGQLFNAVKRLDLKYEAINDCCRPRALRIVEVARKRGYDFSLAYHLAGGIAYKSQLKEQGWSDEAIKKEMGFLYDWNTTLLPNISKFYAWNNSFSGWVYHVAPLARVTIAPGRTCDMIFDPALFSEPVPLKRWTDFQRDTRSKLYIVGGTDPCIPWQDPSKCVKPDIDKELATCAAVEENSSSHADTLIGRWESTNPKGLSLRITGDGSLALMEGKKLLLSGLLQHSLNELEINLLAFEVHEPSEGDWPKLMGGGISRLPYSLMTINQTPYLTLPLKWTGVNEVEFEKVPK